MAQIPECTFNPEIWEIEMALQGYRVTYGGSPLTEKKGVSIYEPDVPPRSKESRAIVDDLYRQYHMHFKEIVAYLKKKTSNFTQSIIEGTIEKKYVATVNAPGMVGEISHGDRVIMDSTIEPKYGDLVGVITSEGSLLMTLDSSLQPGRWEKLPYDEAPTSTAVPIVVGTILGTDKQVSIKMSDCLAVHLCLGKAENLKQAA